MVPALITLGSDSSFWFQLTQGQFGDYLIAQEWRGEEKRPCRAAAMECVGEELLKKADGFSLSFLLLFLSCFFPEFCGTDNPTAHFSPSKLC